MKNLGTVLSKDLIEAALEKAISDNLTFRTSNKYSIAYKGRRFPPKEIARLAAELGGIPRNSFGKFRLNGGNSINDYFRRFGFVIVEFASAGDNGTALNGTNDPKRLVRLCWNDKRWKKPSGWEGKSTSQNTHEGKYGYGHEEWLFEYTKLINGYHYGFIEAIRRSNGLHENKTFDVQFYTINGLTKSRYWAGRISKLEILDSDTAENIRQQYDELGWLSPMEEQVREIQRQKPEKKADGWSNYHGLDQFNVRFLPEHYCADDLYLPIPHSNPIEKLNRYMFNHQNEKYMDGIIRAPEPFLFKGTNKALNEDHANDIQTRTYIREPQEVQIPQLHEKISYGLTKYLREIHGDESVDFDYPAGFLEREIDIVAEVEDSITFYEIKTYPSLIKSIRVAIGQIMEYALWESTVRADRLIIVTQPFPESEAALRYVAHIRDTYGLPLYYQSFDWKSNTLLPSHV